MKDEIIQEVWKAKEAVAARHHYDVRRLVDRLRSEENVQLRGELAVDDTFEQRVQFGPPISHGSHGGLHSRHGMWR